VAHRAERPLGTIWKVSLDVGIQMYVSRINSQEEFPTGNSQEEFSTVIFQEEISTEGNFQEEFSTEFFLNFFLEFSKLFQKVLGRQLN
jgi:hypothetical protein